MLKYILPALLLAAPALAQAPQQSTPAPAAAQFCAVVSQSLVTNMIDNDTLKAQVAALTQQIADLKAPPKPAAPPK